MSFKYPERERCQAHALQYMTQFLQTAAWLCVFKPSEPRQDTLFSSEAFLFSSEDGIGEQEAIMEGSILIRKAGLGEKEEKGREGKG